KYGHPAFKAMHPAFERSHSPLELRHSGLQGRKACIHHGSSFGPFAGLLCAGASVEQGVIEFREHQWHLSGKDGWEEEPCSLRELKHQIHILYRLSCCPPAKIVHGCTDNGSQCARVDFHRHITVVRPQGSLSLW